MHSVMIHVHMHKMHSSFLDCFPDELNCFFLKKILEGGIWFYFKSHLIQSQKYDKYSDIKRPQIKLCGKFIIDQESLAEIIGFHFLK